MTHARVFLKYLILMSSQEYFFMWIRKQESDTKKTIYFRSSHWRCSIKKVVLKNFAKFTGKYRARASFWMKLQASGLQLYLKKTLTQVFSCEFCQISKNTFFTEHLWMTASAISLHNKRYSNFVNSPWIHGELHSYCNHNIILWSICKIRINFMVN